MMLIRQPCFLVHFEKKGPLSISGVHNKFRMIRHLKRLYMLEKVFFSGFFAFLLRGAKSDSTENIYKIQFKTF